MENVLTNNGVSKSRYKEPDAERRSFNSLNLLRVESYLFDYSSKSRSKSKLSISDERHFTDPTSKKPVIVIPNDKYGMPGTLAYKVWDAFLDKLSSFSYPLPESVSFGYRELHSTVRTGRNGGHQNKDIRKAIKQLTNTEIELWLYHPDDKGWKSHEIKLFGDVTYSGAERGKISTVALALHSTLRDDLNRIAYCMNHSRLAGLDPIGKLLFKYIYFSFCRRFSSSKSKNFNFKKSYTDIVSHWMGGMAVKKYPRHITDQLGARFDSISETGLNSKWKITKSKSKGFNLTFQPGENFFTDYWSYYVAGSVLIDLCDSTLNLESRDLEAEAHALVREFHLKRTGLQELDDSFFYNSETELAKTIVSALTSEEARDFIKFVVEKATSTGFLQKMKTFTAAKSFYFDFLAVKDSRKNQRENRRKIALVKEQQEKDKLLLNQYYSAREEVANSRREKLSKEELDRITENCRKSIEEEESGRWILSTEVNTLVTAMLAKEEGFPLFDVWKEEHGTR